MTLAAVGAVQFSTTVEPVTVAQRLLGAYGAVERFGGPMTTGPAVAHGVGPDGGGAGDGDGDGDGEGDGDGDGDGDGAAAASWLIVNV